MFVPGRTPLLAALVLLSLSPLSVSSLHAQPAADPSGHWEGSIQAPGTDLSIAVDLAKNAKGELAGTVSVPAQHIKGFPLSNVAVDGTSVSFRLKGSAPGQRAFTATFISGGKTMSGDVALQAGTAPFSLTRTGDARIEAPPKNAPIGKEMEGTWNGTLDVDGGLRLVLTLSNQPDGTSTGSVLNVNEGLDIPIGIISQTPSGLRLDFTAVGASYTGASNGEGKELVGTFTQGALELQLTFRRAPSEDKR